MSPGLTGKKALVFVARAEAVLEYPADGHGLSHIPLDVIVIQHIERRKAVHEGGGRYDSAPSGAHSVIHFRPKGVIVAHRLGKLVYVLAMHFTAHIGLPQHFANLSPHFIGDNRCGHIFAPPPECVGLGNRPASRAREEKVWERRLIVQDSPVHCQSPFLLELLPVGRFRMPARQAPMVTDSHSYDARCKLRRWPDLGS